MPDPRRKQWNEQQQALRSALTGKADHANAIKLFLDQHAMLHTADVSSSGLFSFEDEALQGVSESQMRLLPPGCEHSIAWNLWHLSRIEDITMNMLVAGGGQIYNQEGWSERLKSPIQDTGSAMHAQAVETFSQAVDVTVLRAYRLAVGCRTRQVVQQLQPGDFTKKVDPLRIGRVRFEGGVVAGAGWLLDYWAGLTIAGLLLMPPTRHIFVHLNEITMIRKKLVNLM